MLARRRWLEAGALDSFISFAKLQAAVERRS
jgi:hypothetical protein